jgi:competence protein ComEA
LWKLTSKEQKLVILLGVLLVLGLVLRFTLPEQGVAGKMSPAGGAGNVSFQSSLPKTDGEQQNGSAEDGSIEKKLIVVHVVGEVHNPGIYTLEEGSRVYEAVEKAGGCLENAALDRINLAQPLIDGQQVPIPSVHEQDPNATIPGDSGSGQDGLLANPGAKVNINTATATQLEALPGIGKVKAGNIVSYREKNGLFKSIEELTNVNGIGEKTLEGIKDLVTIY